MRVVLCASLASTLLGSTALAQIQPRLPTAKPAAQPLIPTTRTPAATAAAPQGASGVGAVQALLNQAAAQRKRGRKDLGAQALQRALKESPSNAQVFQRLAAYALEDGDIAGAERWTRQLRAVAGAADARVAALDRDIKTRMTASNEVAPSSSPFSEGRKEVAARPATPPDPSGASRAAGFEALERKDLAAAEHYFSQALRERSSDLDAAGGLGIIRLRQERFSEAQDLLRRASRGVSGDPRWGEALRAAQFFSDLGQARAAYEGGRFEQAEQTSGRLAAGTHPNRIEAQVLWGQSLAALGRPAEAEAAFQKALAIEPQRLEAVTGLAQALADLGRYDEASQRASGLTGAAAGQIRASIERARATDLQSRGDVFGAGAALSAALSAMPSNPWSRYDYARFLAEQGQGGEAQSLMAPLYLSSDPEALQAAALFSESRGRNEEAVGLLRRVPEASRNRAVRDLAARVEAQSLIEQARRAAAQGRTVDGVSLLRGYLGRNTPSFVVRGQIAETLLDLGDGYQSAALALEAARRPPASFKPSEASGFMAVLAQTGQDTAAMTLLNAAAQQAQAAPSEQAGYRSLAALYSARRADRLRLSGDFAAAFDTLSQGFATAPRDPVLLAALARLYGSGNLPQQALQTYDVLLAINPNDGDALAGSARAAISAGDYPHAESLLRRAVSLKPNDPELYFQIGQMEQARGRERAALKAFERAQALLVRGQAPQGGSAASFGGPLGPNPFAARLITQVGDPGQALGAAPSAPRLQTYPPPEPQGAAAYGSLPDYPQTSPVSGLATMGPSLPANGPGVSALLSGASVLSPAGYGAPAPVAPSNGQMQTAFAPSVSPATAYASTRQVPAASAQIAPAPETAASLPVKVNREIAALRESTAPQIEGEANLRTRSGEKGASRLFEANTRIAASISPFGIGRLGVAVSPVIITAGAPTESAIETTGSNALLVAEATAAGNVIILPSQDGRSESGAGVSLFYESGPFSADAGVTPVGFLRSNFSGGLTARLGLGDDAQLRATIEQRPVTDSVLSYSGDRDSLTGVEWGGVIRRNISLGGSANFTKGGAYFDGAYRRLTGYNVADNTGFELNAGAYFRPIDNDGERLQLGVNANMQAYDRNLRFFSFGHGGYFSPQQFVSLALPVSYTVKRDRWRAGAGFSVGVQAYSEDSAPVFPNNPAAQTALETYSAIDPSIESRYASQSRTGIGLTGQLSGEYKISNGAAAGGELSLDTFGIYNEYKFRFYLRRILTSQ